MYSVRNGTSPALSPPTTGPCTTRWAARSPDWTRSSRSTRISASSSRTTSTTARFRARSSLCGLRVGRQQTLAFAVSAGCAGLGGGLYAMVLNLATPSAFPLQLSLSLLTGVVVGGLGTLTGAVWGAALLVLLPSWSNDLAHSLSLSTNVQGNLPFAIYGLVLIVAMLAWPTGIQGGVAKLTSWVRARGEKTGGAQANQGERGS